MFSIWVFSSLYIHGFNHVMKFGNVELWSETHGFELNRGDSTMLVVGVPCIPGWENIRYLPKISTKKAKKNGNAKLHCTFDYSFGKHFVHCH